MSAIAGISYWDGRPVNDAELASLATHCRAAGSDGGGAVMPIPGLALQAHVLRFDRLSSQERQPLAFAQGSVLTWDGRLDNREDLLLCLHQDLGPDLSDAAVVATAYTRWGTDCLERLLGDWSLAIWDAPGRTIVLARDYMGNRPLYYRRTVEGIAWSTRLESLVACFGLHTQPDDAFVAGKLTFGVPPELTPFHSVRKLLAGHVLLARSHSDVVVRRYWTFSPATVQYHDPRDYGHRLRELLTEGVRVRLRAGRTVWSQLSGGWDSSSNVCLANALIRRGCVEAPRLQPLSWVSTESPESDESRYIAAVERWCGLTTVRSEYSGHPTFEDLLGHTVPFPDLLLARLDGPVAEVGDQIMLTGTLGDLAMLRAGRVALLEPLHQGHLLRTLRLCVDRARGQRAPLLYSLLSLAMDAYGPPHLQHAVTSWRYRARRARREGVRRGNLAGVFGITESLLSYAPPNERLRYPDVSDFPFLKRRVVKAMYGCAESEALTSSDFLPRVWYTCPYAHRPLIEFVLAVPQLALWDPRIMRAGMRRALTDILPPDILKRSTKGRPQAALNRDRRERAARLMKSRASLGVAEDWQLVKREYVDVGALSRALARSGTHDPGAGTMLNLWLPLEAWLRTLAGMSGQGQPTPSPAVIRPDISASGGVGAMSLTPVRGYVTSSQR